MIKQIFTWWNSQTLGTFLYTLFNGKLIGRDEFGNKYYENKKGKRENLARQKGKRGSAGRQNFAPISLDIHRAYARMDETK